MHDVEGAVMAPGMIMTRDTPGEAMRDMAAVDPDAVRFIAPVDARGDQELAPRIEDGVKVFDLETSVIEWNILPNEPVLAYAFNGQVPGPRLRVTEGDRVRINVTNQLPESTTVHWHGLMLPNAMDGPAEITQEPIAPGETFTYEFVTEQRGTYFYHSHDHIDRQQALGLYGALIIDPREPADYPYDVRSGIGRAAAGTARARGVLLAVHADGGWAAQLLYHQRQGLPRDADGADARRRDVAGALHWYQ